MARRDGKKQVRKAKAGRRLLVGVGAGAGVFLAAAAMATGSAVTAAPAHADFEDLLDPIIQPLLTSFTDAVSTIDPAAAVDLTSWTDSLLSSLSSVDLALPAAAEPASAVAAAAEPAATAPATADIPITIGEDTEPTVAATVDGASTSLLVDTGSSGLVVPLTTLDGGSTNFLTELETLSSLGTPTGISESGFGGVDYLYLTYDNATVNYGDGVLTTTDTPVEVEVYSYDSGDFSSLFTNDAFQQFDTDNDVTGVLGIGNDVSGGAGTSPLEAAGFDGVTVDEPANDLIVSSTPDTTGVDLTASGSTVSGLTETVTTSTGTAVGTPTTVSDDLDSGGVYGTIPSAISSTTLAQGDVVTVSDNGTTLYSYTVGTDSDMTDEAPTVTSGTAIDSGVIPFEDYPISIDYSNGDIYLDN